MRTKTGIDKYVINDPWHVRLRETLALLFVCPWRGHTRYEGFDGGFKPCTRCDR